MNHLYDEKFFNWVDSGARRSARTILPLLAKVTSISSVVDIGCGRGTWLAVWREMGVHDVCGVDGEYVDRKTLNIPVAQFIPHDLATAFPIDRRFDLAQCLEVAEHLENHSSQPLVETLCKLADIVLFSAAQPGQGGENHVNEQPPEFWADLFSRQGFDRFDYIRPLVARNAAIEPWYRFNTFLYANKTGQAGLAHNVIETRVPVGEAAREFGGTLWRLRKTILRPLPVKTVTGLSRANYKLQTTLRKMRGA
jgi:SAM-dependent methyltransferase